MRLLITVGCPRETGIGMLLDVHQIVPQSNVWMFCKSLRLKPQYFGVLSGSGMGEPFRYRMCGGVCGTLGPDGYVENYTQFASPNLESDLDA